MRAELALVKQEEQLDLSDKAYAAHRLSLGGTPWKKIAQICGYSSEQAACRAVRMYLDQAAIKLSDERKQDALERQLQRCEALIEQWWLAALAGDIEAANYVLKIMDTENKLLKLYEEQGGEKTTKYVVINTNRQEYAKELEQIARQPKAITTKDSD